MAASLGQEEWDRRAEAVGLVWLEPVANRRTKTKARCDRGHMFTLYPDSVTKGWGCPTCGWQAAGVKRRASQDDWDRRAQAVGIRWLEPVLTADKPTAAQCLCGHEWRPEPAGVGKGQGCPECATSGWKDTRPGVLYVVVNPEAGRVKIGKTNAPDSRMYRHQLDGFTDLVWMSDEAPGYEVSAAEVAALAMVGVEPVRGREYFALAPGLLVADVVEIASRAIGRARAAA